MTFPQYQPPDLSSVDKITKYHKRSFKKISNARLQGVVGNDNVLKIIEAAQIEKAGTITIHLKNENDLNDEEDS